MEKLTIKTSEWQRGRIIKCQQRVLWSQELNSGCCLGHFCHKLRNFSLEELEGQNYPSMLKTDIDKLIDENTQKHTFFTSQAMNINDSEMRDSERINQLKSLFQNVNVELEFIVDSELY